MRKIALAFTLLLVIENTLFSQAIPQDSLYLGQTPPGNTPVIFNLPINNGLRPVERIAISTNGNEIFFGLLNTYPPTIQKTKCYQYFNNKWQGPFDVFANHAAPKLNSNDSIIFLQTNINDFSTTYISLKTDTGWTLPTKFYNTTQQTHYFQTTALNNAYLSSNLPNSPNQRDICKLIINRSDTVIQSLGLPINSSYDENDLFVSNDETFLLFSRNSSGGGDIYICFKKANGKWTNPKKLSEPINHAGYNWEYGMFVTKDNKYLFYTSGGTSMNTYYTYWVKIDNIIDSLKYTNFTPYLNILIPNQTDSIGSHYNYTFSDSTFVDDDGNNTLTYSAKLSNGNPLPAWLNFDASTKTFFGTPTTSGLFSIKVSATDTANAVASCIFNLQITDPLTNINQNNTKTSGFMFYQNYPNPFYSFTTIEFILPENNFVTLKVFDIFGKEVRHVFNGNLDKGNHTFNFDAHNLPSGIYFYAIKTNSFFDKKKMIIIN